jgi:hypothetical protein
MKNSTATVAPIRAALKNGVLVRVGSRLQTEPDWRGLLNIGIYESPTLEPLQMLIFPVI